MVIDGPRTALISPAAIVEIEATQHVHVTTRTIGEGHSSRANRPERPGDKPSLLGRSPDITRQNRRAVKL